MAKQSNVFTAEGKVGKASFYKSGANGYLLRQKGGISAARMASDPKFANTRKNGQEFGRAGKAGKLVRNGFATLLKNGSDGTITRRLTSQTMVVVQADTTHPFGDRVILSANLLMLKKFECNANATLLANMTAPSTTTIDRAGGKLSVAIPSFVPKTSITPPPSATHYKLVAASAELDFTNDAVVSGNSQLTDALPLDNNPTVAVNLQCTASANSTLPLFLVLGIQYFIMINGNLDPIGDGKSNALQIIEVSVV